MFCLSLLVSSPVMSMRLVKTNTIISSRTRTITTKNTVDAIQSLTCVDIAIAFVAHKSMSFNKVKCLSTFDTYEVVSIRSMLTRPISFTILMYLRARVIQVIV
jgi:hypothetical protein